MFNPPYTLQLCEFIPTKYSDSAVKVDLEEYLRKGVFICQQKERINQAKENARMSMVSEPE